VTDWRAQKKPGTWPGSWFPDSGGRIVELYADRLKAVSDGRLMSAFPYSIELAIDTVVPDNTIIAVRRFILATTNRRTLAVGMIE